MSEGPEAERALLTRQIAEAELEIRRANKTTGCTSFVQRRLQCAYGQAQLILDEMVKLGIITELDENGARRLLHEGPP